MHLIGHSFGGLTIRLLLHYLEKQAFPGHDTSPDWVRCLLACLPPWGWCRQHRLRGMGLDPSYDLSVCVPASFLSPWRFIPITSNRCGP